MTDEELLAQALPYLSKPQTEPKRPWKEFKKKRKKPKDAQKSDKPKRCWAKVRMTPEEQERAAYAAPRWVRLTALHFKRQYNVPESIAELSAVALLHVCRTAVQWTDVEGLGPVESWKGGYWRKFRSWMIRGIRWGLLNHTKASVHRAKGVRTEPFQRVKVDGRWETWQPEDRVEIVPGSAEHFRHDGEDRKLAGRFLSWLTPREAMIVQYRFMAGLSLLQIAEGFGLTKERVRQIEIRGLRKIQRRVNFEGIHPPWFEKGAC